jgi:hypothetical protein
MINRRNETCNFNYKTLDDTIILEDGLTARGSYLYNWGCPKYGKPHEWEWTRNTEKDWRSEYRVWEEPVQNDDWTIEIDSNVLMTFKTVRYERKSTVYTHRLVEDLRRKHPVPSYFYDQCKNKDTGEYFSAPMPILMGPPEREDPLSALIDSPILTYDGYVLEAPMRLWHREYDNIYIFDGWIKLREKR